MALTYELIASQTLASNASSYTFSSIPNTYTHLVLVANWKALAAQYGMFISFNGTTSGQNQYSYVYILSELGSTGTGVGYPISTRDTIGMGYNGAGSAAFDGVLKVYIPFYTSSYTKTVTYRSGSGDYYDNIQGFGNWSGTGAINSIRIAIDGFANRTSFTTGSKFYLYGIKGA